MSFRSKNTLNSLIQGENMPNGIPFPQFSIFFFNLFQKINRLPQDSGNRSVFPEFRDVFYPAWLFINRRIFTLFLGNDRFPRKLHLVAFFADTFDEYLLAFLEFVTHVFDAAI